MKKKGQGLSMETMVIMALLMIVLVVSIYFLTGSSKQYKEGLYDCDSKGGQEKTVEECKDLGGIAIFTLDKEKGQDKAKVCCMI